jgi:hypothetical protein
MYDPYAQQHAIAKAMQEAESRNERAVVIEKLDEILALLRTKSKSKPAVEVIVPVVEVTPEIEVKE